MPEHINQPLGDIINRWHAAHNTVISRQKKFIRRLSCGSLERKTNFQEAPMFRTLLAATALTLFAAPAGFAGLTKKDSTEQARIGPSVGDMHADFAAVRADGTAITLADISAANGSVVVFSRSLEWCPFCQKQAKELVEATAPLAAEGWSLNLITYDTPEKLTAFGERNGISYTLLSDTGSAMINAFGLRNHEMPQGSKYDGIPHPAIIFLSPEGEVLAMLREEGYKNRPPVETVLTTAKSLTTTR